MLHDAILEAEPLYACWVILLVNLSPEDFVLKLTFPNTILAYQTGWEMLGLIYRLGPNCSQRLSED